MTNQNAHFATVAILGKPPSPTAMALLVDDQIMVVEAIRRCLANQPGIDFHYCTDSAKAIDLANQLRPTVILQNLIMPEAVANAFAGDSLQPVPLHFIVRDTGIGIPFDKLDWLSKSCSQVDSSTTRQYGGSGLGLAVCQRLCASMGGRIWVESESGEGSAFHFIIQAEPSSATMAEIGLTKGGKASVVFDMSMAERHPLRILLTDDDAMGRQPLTACNGVEALALLEQQIFDIVFMDMLRPEMDGREATRRITDRWPVDQRPRIIAMTAEALEGDREKCLATGMDDYVPKPVRVDDMLAVLERSRVRQ